MPVQLEELIRKPNDWIEDDEGVSLDVWPTRKNSIVPREHLFVDSQLINVDQITYVIPRVRQHCSVKAIGRKRSGIVLNLSDVRLEGLE